MLNPATGHISPQFHCTYDDYFETPKLEGNIDVHWKRLAHMRCAVWMTDSNQACPVPTQIHVEGIPFVFSWRLREKAVIQSVEHPNLDIPFLPPFPELKGQKSEQEMAEGIKIHV